MMRRHRRQKSKLMEEESKPHVHLAALVSNARLQQGSSTLREFYRSKNPPIDYQSWLHVESGRRIPSPGTLLIMGEILNIPREDLIAAYCKDKFGDLESHQVIEAMQLKGLFDVDTLLQLKEYDRTSDYVFTAEQVKAMQADLRIRLYLIYTYDREFKTTVSRLANFFGVEHDEAKSVIERLRALGLVETDGECVKKIHPHTTIPMTADIASLRKQILVKSLELSLEPESYISNIHVTITEKSYKKILRLFDFIEANLFKMEREDMNDTTSSRYQIAISGTRLREASSAAKNKQSIS